MYRWGFEQLRPWLGHRTPMPVGPLFCVIDGPSRGRPWSADAAPSFADSRRRPASGGAPRPDQLRRAHAVELAPEGVPLDVIQRRLGHTNLGVTSVYLPGIDDAGIIAA
jgi:integrase